STQVGPPVFAVANNGNPPPANAITNAQGQVNFTLSGLHSNTFAENPTVDGPKLPFQNCTVSGATGAGCVCDATLDGGETYACHAGFSAGISGAASIVINVLDEVNNASVPVSAELDWTIDASSPTVVFNTTPQVNGCTTDGDPASVVVSKGV